MWVWGKTGKAEMRRPTSLKIGKDHHTGNGGMEKELFVRKRNGKT